MDENQTFDGGQTIDNDRIIKINIEEEMKSSYIDYSMSVIVARALPDVRDGFKPVHRRILYGMAGIGNTSDKPYKKCARVVGEVLGKYHPHGDSSVYGGMVHWYVWRKTGICATHWLTDKVTSVVLTATLPLLCDIPSAVSPRWVSISWTTWRRIPLTW